MSIYIYVYVYACVNTTFVRCTHIHTLRTYGYLLAYKGTLGWSGVE